MSAPQGNEAEKNIEIWKVKYARIFGWSLTVLTIGKENFSSKIADRFALRKLIKRLEAARGNGTSMISLIIRTSSILPHAKNSHTEVFQRLRIRSHVLRRCWQKSSARLQMFVLLPRVARFSRFHTNGLADKKFGYSHLEDFHQLIGLPRSCKSAVGAFSHHIYTAASQALHKSASQWTGRILWRNNHFVSGTPSLHSCCLFFRHLFSQIEAGADICIVRVKSGR